MDLDKLLIIVLYLYIGFFVFSVLSPVDLPLHYQVLFSQLLTYVFWFIAFLIVVRIFLIVLAGRRK
jgi:hypothetical protein